MIELQMIENNELGKYLTKVLLVALWAVYFGSSCRCC